LCHCGSSRYVLLHMRGIAAVYSPNDATANVRLEHIDSSLAGVSHTDGGAEDMKADYRRDFEAEDEEDPGEMKADYRRDVEAEDDEDPGEMKADYRRNTVIRAEIVETPRAKHRRNEDIDSTADEDLGGLKADY
jgi:hypothetical protein